MIRPSELIVNPDGSIYHLNLLPEMLTDTIITVGDPDRVDQIALRFDAIYFEEQKREFKSVAGRVGDKDVMVISTGIGTDNIDIVFNELDALANIDLDTREKKVNFKPLNFIRIGTSGSLTREIPMDSFLISRIGVGFDNLLHYYNSAAVRELLLEDVINQLIQPSLPDVKVYATKGSESLALKFSKITDVYQGITITMPGFYGPQGRQLNAPNKAADFLDTMRTVTYDNLRVTNLEMETSGIYGLSALLGHQAISINALLANRENGTFSADPHGLVNRLIDEVFTLL